MVGDHTAGLYTDYSACNWDDAEFADSFSKAKVNITQSLAAAGVACTPASHGSSSCSHRLLLRSRKAASGVLRIAHSSSSDTPLTEAYSRTFHSLTQ